MPCGARGARRENRQGGVRQASFARACVDFVFACFLTECFSNLFRAFAPELFQNTQMPTRPRRRLRLVLDYRRGHREGGRGASAQGGPSPW
eukprot:4563872-Alexandrium_andersonii.AAC.1